jgi:hypothetical protein
MSAPELASAVPTPLPAGRPGRTPPVKAWALVGALVLVFIAAVLVRWVSGPFFQAVPSGPSDPPTWMKANLVFWQVVSPPAALALIYNFVVRPWRRERTIGLDGCFVIAFSTLWFWDPLCNYTGSWVTYNSWMINMGSWHSSVPGSASFAAPGQMLAEPLLLIPALYVYFFWLACLQGSWVMRRIARRWPDAGRPTLIGGCFAVIFTFDFVLEGLIWMPGGAWTLAGGHVPLLFPGTYHQFTLNEWIPVSITLTAAAAIRHFRDDRGRTIADRGLDELKVSPGRKLGYRILAVTGAVHVAMFSCYVLPNIFLGLHTQAWPAQVQQRSYFTDYLCGQGTDRACPGPSVPNLRNNNAGGGSASAYLDRDGKLVLPAGVVLPRPVPFGP